MKQKSICVGCAYARWDRYPSGRLDKHKSGKCTWTLDARLPKAFIWIQTPTPIGGRINRKRLFNSDPTACDFRKEEEK
jgi:hypothetical protein